MLHRYLVIEGNIGAGKTTLSQKLASDWNARLVLEEFADNPFLPKFYEQPERYAFPLELSFLSERFTQLKKELQEDLFSSSVLADYFLPKCSIFARNNLHGDEKHLFDKVYDIIETNFPQPDLLVYLYVETPRLLKNIQSRGRSYEQHITAEYLEDIQQQYLLYFKQHPDLPVLMINTTLLDFKTDELAYTQLQKHINQSYPPGITRITL